MKWMLGMLAALAFLVPSAIAGSDSSVFELNEEINGVQVDAKAVVGADVSTCTAKVSDDMGNLFEFKIEDSVDPENDKFETKGKGDATNLLDGVLLALDFCLDNLTILG